jgi:hypothetical protein
MPVHRSGVSTHDTCMHAYNYSYVLCTAIPIPTIYTLNIIYISKKTSPSKEKKFVHAHERTKKMKQIKRQVSDLATFGKDMVHVKQKCIRIYL